MLLLVAGCSSSKPFRSLLLADSGKQRMRKQASVIRRLNVLRSPSLSCRNVTMSLQDVAIVFDAIGHGGLLVGLHPA